MAKRKRVEITDFRFLFRGHGHYSVVYTSPKTGKAWVSIINDMTIIDRTKNEDNPKQKDLIELMRICKKIA